MAHGRTVLLVSASLGTAGFLLEGRPGDWCVRTTRRGPRRIRRLGRFLRRWLGGDVPIASARYWIFALPAPGRASYIRYDRHRRVRLIRQEGWSVRYRRYTVLAGRALPDRLRLTHRGLLLKLLVDRWTIGGTREARSMRSESRRDAACPE
jgi:outer membrane biogenesis lipoprotein LolB